MSGLPSPLPGGRNTPARVGATALRRTGEKLSRPLRLRLVDAVTLAAAGLLLLKVATLLAADPRQGPMEFARALAKARTGYEFSDPATTGSVTPKEPAKPAERPPEPAPPPAAAEPASPTERALLEKLSARRDVLRQRDEELDLRERLLKEAERKLQSGVGDLRDSEERADAAKAKAAEAEKAALKNLVTMYETMKPKDAARVFDRLGHEVLVPIVLATNPRKMAEILAVMQPEAAERLTVALANKARGVAPTQEASAGLPANELPAIELPRLAR